MSRLDRDTSGLLVAATSPAGAECLTEQFKDWGSVFSPKSPKSCCFFLLFVGGGFIPDVVVFCLFVFGCGFKFSLLFVTFPFPFCCLFNRFCFGDDVLKMFRKFYFYCLRVGRSLVRVYRLDQC